MAMCRNPKPWIAFGAAAVVVAIAVPSWGSVLPVLLVAACPLMMLLMAGGMAGMARRGRDDTVSADEHEVARLRAEVAQLRQTADR